MPAVPQRKSLGQQNCHQHSLAVIIIINAKACPGADADSDHNFTVADVNIK